MDPELEAFINKCKSWGLLPNTTAANNAYKQMEIMPPMHVGAGFASMLRKLAMRLPDALNDVTSLEQLKRKDARDRLSVVLACHEIFHYLHFLIDKTSFVSRSRKKMAGWDNEEELLTIAGDTGTIALPHSVSAACNPKLFNEHSLCRFLGLSNRPDHHSTPVDATSAGTVDLSALPTGLPLF